MSIEQSFDLEFIAGLALREKQLQQHYRPVIAVHKWFARRPGTLFRGLLLAEFGSRPIRESFFEPHSFAGKTVADPFMGGGTPVVEANRVGCRVLGTDINPMSVWIVKEELNPIDLHAYQACVADILERLYDSVGHLYQTDCPFYGDKAVPVKYFLWVKTLPCEYCDHSIDLFPGYLVAENVRHTHYVVVCSVCGELNQVLGRDRLGRCQACRERLHLKGPATRGKCRCPQCGRENTYPRPETGPLEHRLFAIEYWNPHRDRTHAGRFFKKPDAADLRRYREAEVRWRDIKPRFTPQDSVRSGDESTRLHRWGYKFYRELFNHRQLLALESLACLIADIPEKRIKSALATNLSDLLRYQNMLCRYDTRSLKSLDVFSVHGFPVGLIQCESNFLGIVNSKGQLVGSGGLRNVAEKYRKAKEYCNRPFEVYDGSKKRIFITGERIAADPSQGREVRLCCRNAREWPFARIPVDAVFTDPPYYGNVQYAELMDFCYVWLRKLMGNSGADFSEPTTRRLGELTGNASQGRGLVAFTEGLATVFCRMAEVLKPNCPLVFTFHHNCLDPYYAVGVAILDSQLHCTASIPCPAEMGGSIHIHGTESSVVDSIFVCRKRACSLLNAKYRDKEQLSRKILEECNQLRRAGLKVRRGDVRCILYGHLTRVAVTMLTAHWNRKAPTEEKLSKVQKKIGALGESDHWAEELWQIHLDSVREKKQLRLF